MVRLADRNLMKCPQCGAWVQVMETRNKPDGSRRRRYECGNLHRFTTLETVVESKKSGGRMT